MDIQRNPEVIITERLILRPLQDCDAGLISLYVGDKRVALNLAVVPHPYPDGAAQAYIEYSRKTDTDEIIWAMVLNNELIGVIAITPNETGRAKIGYWLAPQFWGAGFTPEAVEAVVKYARVNRFKGLDASVHQGNQGSARVLIKEGFEYCGDSETHSIPRGGMVQSWNYALDFSGG